MIKKKAAYLFSSISTTCSVKRAWRALIVRSSTTSASSFVRVASSSVCAARAVSSSFSVSRSLVDD